MSPKGAAMPRSPEAERAVLCACTVNPEAIDEVAEIVTEADWYSAANATLWTTILALHAAGRTPDMLTLQDALGSRLHAIGGVDYLLEITGSIPPPNVRDHARIIRDKALLRRVVQTCGEVYAAGLGDVPDVRAFLDESEAKVFAAAESRHATGGPVHVRDAVIERMSALAEQARNPGRLLGLATGFPDLDRKLCGLKPGELILVAGRPGMGKSAFAGGVVGRVCETGGTALVFSLEMPRTQWIERALAGWGRVDGNKIRSAMLSHDDWGALNRAATEIAAWPLYIDDEAGLSLMAMRSRARRVRRSHGLAVMVVDYLQLATSGRRNESREQEVAEISRGLKGLAKELEIPVVALAQLNRGTEQRGDKRPTLGDLRESGQLEQDADAILFLYRDELYNRATQDAGIAEIIIGKQRSGPLGTVRARFDARTTMFTPLAEGEEYRDD